MKKVAIIMTTRIVTAPPMMPPTSAVVRLDVGGLLADVLGMAVGWSSIFGTTPRIEVEDAAAEGAAGVSAVIKVRAMVKV